MSCCVIVVNTFQASGVFCEISYCYQCKQSPKAPTHCVYVGGVETTTVYLSFSFGLYRMQPSITNALLFSITYKEVKTLIVSLIHQAYTHLQCKNVTNQLLYTSCSSSKQDAIFSEGQLYNQLNIERAMASHFRLVISNFQCTCSKLCCVQKQVQCFSFCNSF